MRTGLIPAALIRGAGQLTDPRVLGVLLAALAVVAVLTAPFAIVFVGLAWIVEALTPAELSLPWIGEVRFLGVLTQGLTSWAGWSFWTYVISPLTLAAVGMFLETIVAAVERRHYPALPPVRRRGAGEAVLYGLRFLGLTLSVSAAALIASFFAGWLAPAVFVAANGYLIAREYFETVALRRMPLTEARGLARANGALLWLTGAALALAMTVPVLNLLVPVAGVAAFTHLFQALRATASSG